VAFPTTPLPLVTELYLNNQWINVFTDVREGDGITIVRGARDEAGVPEAQSCELTFDNRSGNYSPRNPNGAYFGQLKRNTPIRIRRSMDTDTFTRTVSNGWGSTDTGNAWTTGTGSGGSVVASDWSVSGGFGKLSIPVANAYRISYLPTVKSKNVDICVDVAMPFTTVTGGSVEPLNVIICGDSSTSYHYVRLGVDTAGVITWRVTNDLGNTGPSQTVTGLSFTANQFLRVRVGLENHAVKAKVWNPTGAEPFDWQHVIYISRTPNPGFVGIRGFVDTGNTNTKPIVFSYDNWAVGSPRYFGEVASWQPTWDLSGNNKISKAFCGGLMRRIGQGKSPEHSTLYSYFLNLATPVLAYWPAEDGADSTSISSASTGVPNMQVTGEAKFASYTDFAASAPLPTVETSRWQGIVPNYTPLSPAQCQLRYFLHVPAGGVTDLNVISQLFVANTNGSIHHWEIKWAQNGGAGGLQVEVWSQADVQLFTSGVIGFPNVLDKRCYLSLELQQNGADIDWVLSVINVGDFFYTFAGGTLTATTMARAIRVVIGPYAPTGQTLPGVAVGHINVRKNITALTDEANGLVAFLKEDSGARLARLFNDHGIFFDRYGPASGDIFLGAQRVKSFNELILESIAAEQGTLYEARNENAIVYRIHNSYTNQMPMAAFDYSAGHIAPPFEPNDDDRFTRNDITVTRTGGAYAEIAQTTGPMSTAEPADGGVGRYDDSVTLNLYSDDQAIDAAGWLLHKGTPDETRYPQVNTYMQAPGVSSNQTLVWNILDIDPGDRITIANPQTAQTPDTISQLVQGYTEYMSDFRHEITFNTAPESPYKVWQLDTATSRLDTDASTLAAGVNTTATSLSVAFMGQRWTTAAGDMPFSIVVDGEQMTVTGVSGTTSPQTFTVTRSANGIVKAHSSGAAVTLLIPCALSL
jgi:hypothetical protein